MTVAIVIAVAWFVVAILLVDRLGPYPRVDTIDECVNCGMPDIDSNGKCRLCAEWEDNPW